jgi:hypothetical protein
VICLTRCSLLPEQIACHNGRKIQEPRIVAFSPNRSSFIKSEIPLFYEISLRNIAKNGYRCLLTTARHYGQEDFPKKNQRGERM